MKFLPLILLFGIAFDQQGNASLPVPVIVNDNYQPEARLLTRVIPENTMSPRQSRVSFSRWDDGINAFFIDYRARLAHLQSGRCCTVSGAELEIELDNGLNYGPWRLRYQNTLWRGPTGQHGIYTRSATLWRSITSWRAELLAGDSETTHTLFDSLPFRGITLATSEAMFPDRWRPYSPWIKGYAKNHAEVTLSQNGLILYRRRVPPGSFVIQDFYPSTRDGTLVLTVKESDGSESNRYLPWTDMPALVQQNHSSYELVAGQYRPWRGSALPRPVFVQASLARGVASDITLYAGVQHSERYASYLAGAGVNLHRLGAFSTDVTWARYRSSAQSQEGSVWRLRYAKAFFDSATSFNALFRYYPSGQQYRSLEEKITYVGEERAWWSDDLPYRLLTQEFWINRYLDEDQSLSLRYTQQTWRRLAGERRELSLSYLLTRDNFDISLWLGHSRERYSRSETTLGLTFSLSLPALPGGGSPSLSYSHNRSRGSLSSQEIGLSGAMFPDYSLRYQLTAMHFARNASRYDASLGYQYNAGESTLRFVQDNQASEYHLDISGSVLLHSEGVTFGQAMSDTMALIVVPNSPGIGNYQQFGVTTNAKGEALVGYLVPWRANPLVLNSWQLPDNVSLPETEYSVMPSKGAIVKAVFLPAERGEGR